MIHTDVTINSAPMGYGISQVALSEISGVAHWCAWSRTCVLHVRTCDCSRDRVIREDACLRERVSRFLLLAFLSSLLYVHCLSPRIPLPYTSLPALNVKQDSKIASNRRLDAPAKHASHVISIFLSRVPGCSSIPCRVSARISTRMGLTSVQIER